MQERSFIDPARGASQEFSGGIKNPGVAPPGESPGRSRVRIKTPSGGIAARSTNTVSSELCDVYVRNILTDDLEQLLDGDANPVQIEVWNDFASEVSGSAFGHAMLTWEGDWVIITEECES